jgi:alkylhydroperoxidase family enzyme
VTYTEGDPVPRIDPVAAPYDDVTAPLLKAMMPEGVEPIGLFRTFVRNPQMASAMHEWGSYELGRRSSLSIRCREIVIARTCAQCRCEYEWGVHVAVFAERAELDASQVASLTRGSPEDGCWPAPADRALIRATDELHETANITDATWAALAGHFAADQILDILLLAGWYHAISFAANGARVDLEPWAPRFTDFADHG